MKVLFLCFFLTVFATEDISGFWKSLNDKGEPQCIFGIYEHEGFYYGKVIGVYNDDGTLTDTIDHPESRVVGISDHPYSCGLDIMYGLRDSGSTFDGKIIDPSKGKTYSCSLWRHGVNLIVRGKLFIFGKNITWYPVNKEDYPKDFKLPDMRKFTPSIPKLY